jgi:hypothetical protein
MYGLIQCLYTENNQKAFKKLYLDSEPQEQMLLRSTIAEALKDCPKLLPSHGSDFILCTLASYHKSEDDTMRVYAGIMRHLENFSIGLLTDDIKYKEINQVADCCLIGLSFFRKYLEIKHQRKAFPSPDYYSRAGATAFSRLGFENISSDFNGWISFITKEMTND